MLGKEVREILDLEKRVSFHVEWAREREAKKGASLVDSLLMDCDVPVDSF